MKNTATVKQTGQGGVSYEDKVIAYFLACLLSETLPFNTSLGLITSVHCQVNQDGWLFDDVLLILQNSDDTNKIAISIKSNQQFNSKGCPEGINQLIWEQYLHHNTSVFNKPSDRLCLIQAPGSSKVSNDLNTLLEHAVVQDNNTLHQRIGVEKAYSKSARQMYQSFYCPSHLSTLYNVSNDETGNLLKCFLYREMDFGSISSRDEAYAINLCKQALKNKTQTEAERLFDALCLIPRRWSPSGGKLNRNGLIQILRRDFNLSDKPSHESDWKRLYTNADNKLAFIPDKLGNTLTIDRSQHILSIEQKLLTNKGIIIQGISGSGKTNLAKQLATKKKTEANIIWLDSSDFDAESIETNLRLTNTIIELIEGFAGKEAFLLVDGIERLYQKGQWQKLAIIIKATLFEQSVWKIIITCPSDQLDKVDDFFSRYNFSDLSLPSFSIPGLSVDELLTIAQDFPDLEAVVFNTTSERIFNNLKLLDKLIRNAKTISALSSTLQLGESHLIDFVWLEEIENKGLQLGYFVKRLASEQADRLSIGISVEAFSVEELKPADELKSSGFIRVQHEKLFFNHDLFGDWARYRLLKSHRDDLAEFLKTKESTSPLWARAIRLYGISLLEQERSGSLWKDTFNLFAEPTPQANLIQDFLLESFFSAPDSYVLLVLHKQTLFDNEYALLKRLTTLFLLRATKPDPQVLALVKKMGMNEKHATAHYRIPVADYWPGILSFLAQEREIVIEHNLNDVVKISSLWLEKTSPDFSFRSEAAILSLEAARKIVALKEKGAFLDKQITEPIYKALLLGYAENPTEVSSICLKICKREVKENETQNQIKDPQNTSSSSRFQNTKLSKPWEWGPADRVDDSFRKVCLDGATLLLILQWNPRLGSEILLAVLIEEPREKWFSQSRSNEHYNIIQEYSWYPPFYMRGPFLKFLKISPAEGIIFICRLADFATERWQEINKPYSDDLKISVFIEGQEREYIGNIILFKWHTDLGNAPHALVSALMALEQLFYEQIDSNKGIETIVPFILKHTKSLALIGLLFTVGKLKPSLFLNELKPFVSEYSFYNWDIHGSFTTLSLGNDLARIWPEQVKQWNERSNRKMTLRDTILGLILNNTEFANHFIPIRESWQKQLNATRAESGDDVFLLQLIHQFNPSNYKKENDENGDYIRFDEPVEVTKYLEEGRNDSLEILQNSHIPHKMQMMIDKNLPFDLAGAEYLWNRLQEEYSEIDVHSTGHCSGEHAWNSRYTNLLAEIKLLIHNRSIWIESHPEYLEWCIDVHEKLIDKQFSWDGVFETHGTDEDWNIFFVEIAILLWKEDSQNLVLRKMIAGAILLFNTQTVKAFFNACSKEFKWNEPDFIQAQNLLLFYSKEYYLNTNEKKNELKEIRNRFKVDFISNVIPNTAISWSSIRSPEEWKEKETNYRRQTDYVRRAGLNTYLLVPMFACLPEEADTEELNSILLLLEQAYGQVIYQLGDISENSLAIKDSPKDFDRIVLQQIGAFILKSEENTAIIFWEPLFRFGYIAPQHIETFCNSFFSRNIRSASSYDRMIDLLGQMASYTSNSPTWHIRYIDRHKDFRICLLGFHPWIENNWLTDYSAFTEKAGDIYKHWFINNKLNPHFIGALLAFMITPSGGFMIEVGLFISEIFFLNGLKFKYHKKPGIIWVGVKELDEKLSTTLLHLWQFRKNEIRKSKPLYAAYRELIQYLLAIQHVIGIELQNALVEE